MKYFPKLLREIFHFTRIIMDKKYYVYVIVNPRKPWNRLDKYKLKNEPFYVGKGSGRRFKVHYENFTNSGSSHNTKLLMELTDLKSRGITPEVKILFKNLTEEQSFEKEKELISYYKLRYKDGVLVNRSEGKAGGWGGDLNPTYDRMELGTHNFQKNLNPQKNTPKVLNLIKILKSNVTPSRSMRLNDKRILSKSGYSSEKALTIGINRVISGNNLPYIVENKMVKYKK